MKVSKQLPWCWAVATAQHTTKDGKANMADEVVEVKTKDQLLAEMKVAMDSGDFKAVSKVSSQIAKVVAGEEKVEKDAKQAAVAKLTDVVKKAIDKAVKPFIDSGELDAADGIWYANDFGEKLTSCRLVKGAARKAGGGGGGKKFNVTTTELLTKHGAELMGDTGKTFQEAYDEDTGGNARYKVRMKLLKADGLS